MLSPFIQSTMLLKFLRNLPCRAFLKDPFSRSTVVLHSTWEYFVQIVNLCRNDGWCVWDQSVYHNKVLKLFETISALLFSSKTQECLQSSQSSIRKVTNHSRLGLLGYFYSVAVSVLVTLFIKNYRSLLLPFLYKLLFVLSFLGA